MAHALESMLAKALALFGIRSLDNRQMSLAMVALIGLIALVLFVIAILRASRQQGVQVSPAEAYAREDRAFELGVFLERWRSALGAIAALALTRAFGLSLSIMGLPRAASGEFFFGALAVLSAILLFVGMRLSKTPSATLLGQLGRQLAKSKKVLIGVCALSLIKSCIVDVSRISGDSLQPRIREGHPILVSRITYALNLPLVGRVWSYGSTRRGLDVIYYATETHGYGFGRIAGLAGETLVLDYATQTLQRDGQSVFQFSPPSEETKKLQRLVYGERYADEIKAKADQKYTKEIRVPEDSVLVVTDTFGDDNPEVVRMKDIVGPIVVAI